MEQINWADKLIEMNPTLLPSRKLYEQRKQEGKLELWERCRLGDILPTKVYEPPTLGKDPRCELCGDVGYRFFWQNGNYFAEECECLGRIQAEAKMKKAGVDRSMTFDSWVTDWEYQIEMASKAYDYADSGYLTGQWLFVGGQVGCGKTHICTAAVNKLLEKNIGCRYMAWRDEAVQLKAIVNEQQEYHERLMELCKAPILYIDDFFKTQKGQRPTQADVNLAFQIINYRYQDRTKATIISSELSTMEIMSIDEAVGSRIHERSKAFRVYVEQDPQKNYRIMMG
jgi:DNA replication protein DnaC